MHTKEQLKQDLYNLGVRPGDSILMHSSYKSLGGIEEGAAGFFEAFLDLLGEEGTLILPTLSYRYVNADSPEFDIRETPSCVGYLTEYFRTQVPGVVRSMHATHSCAMRGKHAAYLAEGHGTDDTPVGPHSPFTKLPKLGGKILILGCHPDHNTTLHGVEQHNGVPYVFNFDPDKRIPYILRDWDGSETCIPSYRHYFIRENGVYAQCYARILNLLTEEEVTHGHVLDADCYLMDAQAVWKRGGDKMHEDPYYFVTWREKT